MHTQQKKKSISFPESLPIESREKPLTEPLPIYVPVKSREYR